MKNIVEIEGEINMVRDLNTMAIINTSHNSLLNAKARKKDKLIQKNKINTLEKKIDLLEKSIIEILTILKDK